MEIADQPLLKFHGVDFPRVIFNAYKPADTTQADIQLSITPHVLFPKNKPDAFEIFAEVKLRRESYFDLDLVAIGHFESGKEIDQELKKSLVNRNAVAILFPYIRAFVTNLTTSLGAIVGPIIVPIQFFTGEVDELKEPEVIDQTPAEAKKLE
ncbi:MAG: hypothetical protein ABSE63_12350 [Thermoguttaceae bacterium]|jgi:preprotein translocase subunit SecB